MRRFEQVALEKRATLTGADADVPAYEVIGDASKGLVDVYM